MIRKSDLLETGPQIGDLVQIDEWIKNMMTDLLILTEEPGPSYASKEVATIRKNDVGVIVDVVVSDVDLVKYEKYYKVLCPGGVGWINSSYVEEIK